MPTVASLIDPFFAWKQGPGRHFAGSSKQKYEPLLRHFAAWAGNRDVATLTTPDLEFDYLAAWSASFEDRHGRPPAQNTVRLVHNIVSSFLDSDILWVLNDPGLYKLFVTERRWAQSKHRSWLAATMQAQLLKPSHP